MERHFVKIKNFYHLSGWIWVYRARFDCEFRSNSQRPKLSPFPHRHWLRIKSGFKFLHTPDQRPMWIPTGKVTIWKIVHLSSWTFTMSSIRIPSFGIHRKSVFKCFWPEKLVVNQSWRFGWSDDQCCQKSSKSCGF